MNTNNKKQLTLLNWILDSINDKSLKVNSEQTSRCYDYMSPEAFCTFLSSMKKTYFIT